MHALITRYPGAPGAASRWWHLFGDAERAARAARRSAPLDRPLAWDEPPASPAEVTELRVMTRTGDPETLPEWVAGLPALRYLEIPLPFLKLLDAGQVPASVEVLHLVGTGSASAPKRLALPQVGLLLSNTGMVKFTPDTFPSLTRLSLQLDGPQRMLDVVAGYPTLAALHLSGVHAADVYARVGALALRYLGLAGGRLATLEGIGAFAGLTSLQLKNLAGLTSLAGIEALDALEELSIGTAPS